MIHLVLEGVPPSSNNAYFNLPKGGRSLTKVGRAYLTETKARLASTYGKEMLFFKPDKPYQIAVRFFFERLENLGWFKGEARNRYKHFDVGNRLKLVEDSLKEAAGIDDSQHLRVLLDKQQGRERTEIWAWDLEEEETPFDVGFISI